MVSNKKVILITGANSGIGYDTSYILANASADNHVIMAARSETKGRKSLLEIEARKPAGTLSFLELDITSDDSIKAATEQLTAKFAAIDVLVNNAGIYSQDGPVSREHLQEVFNTNVFGVLLLTQALEPLLKKSVDPRIINVSSSLGSITLRMDKSIREYHVTGEVYRMSKAALNMLTASLAYQYRTWEHPAKLWAFDPGYVVTNLAGEGDRQNKINNGAESAETSAQGILEVIRGDRDGEMDRFVAKQAKVHPW
ncbi:Short-chain dehydrogenase/reductase tropE like protein [Verticillium longisporum]|uniref:Short-chain dehydrogenase/reductase tropE like protein n=1 Tax=Verticillium longisporum TaxID=100787 RepID=A0A0G4NDL6_VERLO|nr:Short-chain dehydrogenase/reductase tropE like protein [Verticillium longisporum]KAG7141500.1 Short-chain dehydrogenase/reductase tropE like protein [Verticillium longisporum]CRJ80647.1 hypothetical protein BN1708_000327 [Verticillium longisporum]CRK44513.1 hypothetical protein BN1723_006165 [Verticillium longisporum]